MPLSRGFWNQGFKPGDTPDLRVVPFMSGFTADDAEAAINLDDITDLDPFDGAGVTEYDCTGVTIAWAAGAVTISVDDGDFGTPGAGSEEVAGVYVYKFVDGSDANDIFLGYTTQGAGAQGNGVATMNFTLPNGVLFQGSEG